MKSRFHIQYRLAFLIIAGLVLAYYWIWWHPTKPEPIGTGVAATQLAAGSEGPESVESFGPSESVKPPGDILKHFSPATPFTADRETETDFGSRDREDSLHSSSRTDFGLALRTIRSRSIIQPDGIDPGQVALLVMAIESVTAGIPGIVVLDLDDEASSEISPVLYAAPDLDITAEVLEAYARFREQQ